MKLRMLLISSLLFWFALTAQAQQARLVCTADTNLSSYESERDLNYGQASRLRLKGIEMLALFRFDTAPIAGWQVQKATLYLRYAHGDRKLRTLGISTVSAPWEEGTGAGERKPGEACFNWSAQGQTRWAGPDTDFTDVSFTAGHTLASYADIAPLENDWIAVPVEPKLVQALIAGVSYGLAVTDEKGQTAANNDVYSREQSGAQPYLVVEGAPGPRIAPQPLARLTAGPDALHANFNTGALRLTFIAPPDAFAYDVHLYRQSASSVRAAPRSAIHSPCRARDNRSCWTN